MKQQLTANINRDRKCTFDETFFALEKQKINIFQGSINSFLIPFPQTCTVLLFKKLSSVFVICILHIAIWVIQIKCRSCKITKTLTSVHEGTKLEGSLVQLVQILRFKG